MNIEDKLCPHLKRLSPYQPIVPLEVLAAEAGKGVGEVIKLDGNENPYGPSPQVRQALASYPFHHIYPDPDQRELRQALQGYTGLPQQHIVAGAGSDELIDLLLRLFIERGDQVINLVPTFGMYPFSTQVCGGEVVEVERDEAFAIDLPAVRRAVGRRTKVVFVASPNNPTGNLAKPEEIQALLDTGLVVVVDEAYYEFGGATVAPWVTQYDNLVVLRTFSKWAGLAGLRVGYGLFPRRLTDLMMGIKPPYNINTAAYVAAQESLKDLEYLQQRVRAIITERERLFSQLKETDLLHPYPSQANFLLCRVKRGEAQGLYQALRKRGIFLRYFHTPRLRDCLRVSIGLPEQSDVLLEALRELG